ncbi:elongation factor G [Planctomicrobium sp. SH527]|uniref:elongation factor G n=1 Tax=Planctomicrobium sp. SH527 TaxID=3448123 RepID=UPI003F5C0DC4
MTTHLVENLRNIVIVGHGATGKTSLADLMLFKGGVNRRVGSPDEGTSFLDMDEDEKLRHHSISSHLCHLDYKGSRLNLIDAPGMPDFAGQIAGALRATETALIVVNACHGVDSITRRAMREAQEQGLSCWIVINKCDSENANLQWLIEELRQEFGTICAPVTIPLGTGSQLHGVLELKLHPDTIANDAVIDPSAAYDMLLDAVVESNDDLMTRYLNGDIFSTTELENAIGEAINLGTLIPIFCVAVKADIGVTELMDSLSRYAPSPLQRRHHVLKDGEDIAFDPDPQGPLVAQVVKTRIDPFLSKISILRIYSGTLKKESNVHLVGGGRDVRIHQLIDVQGSGHESIDEAIAGDLVAVVRVDELHTGNVISDGADNITLPPITYPRPMIGLAVEPKSQADQAKISTALHKIQEEDPTFQVHREEQTHEMVMEGMSELHLQLIQNRLKQREKVDVLTHAPSVPYRETILSTVEGSYRHKKQSGGSGQFAEVHMRISPCPRDVVPEEYFTKENFPNLRSYHYDATLNFCFIDRVTGGTVPNQFIPAVEKGVREKMTHGVIAGHQIQDIVVELFFGKDHSVDSSELAFKIAGSQCLKEIFLMARPALLEPLARLEISVPTQRIGEITGDLNARRGRIEKMEDRSHGMTMLCARVPVSEVTTYARSLSSMTAGQGTFTSEPAGYEIVPPNEQTRLIAEFLQRKKINETNGNE